MEMVPILRNTKIGEPDAALDQKILMNCFVDSGLLIDLKDTQESSSIVLGRTGAGKTAIILKLCEDLNYVKSIDPHEISFNFIENSSIIKFLDEIGVNLDLFYRYLWRHILITELLQLRYPNAEKKSVFSAGFDFLTGGKSAQEKEAIKYLTQYGGNFWLETDVRLKEVVEVFEKDIRATLGADVSSLKSDLEVSRSNSQEKRSEVIERATKVVNSVQIKELSRVVSYLNDYVFDDDQKKYFLLFDQLDENWTHNNIKYRLVRALVEEIKHLRKIGNVKVIIALRVDLFLSVLDATRDSGFQEDKVESLVVRRTYALTALTKVGFRSCRSLLKSVTKARTTCVYNALCQR